MRARRSGVPHGDAASAAKRSQRVPTSFWHRDDASTASKHGAEVGVRHRLKRGLTDTDLTDGTKRSNLEQLTDWTQWAGACSCLTMGVDRRPTRDLASTRRLHHGGAGAAWRLLAGPRRPAAPTWGAVTGRMRSWRQRVGASSLRSTRRKTCRRCPAEPASRPPDLLRLATRAPTVRRAEPTIFAIGVLCFVRDPTRALSEIARVLVPAKARPR